MAYKHRECRVCHGTMDPEEGCGGVCDNCLKKASNEKTREAAMELLLGPDVAFQQMEMEDYV